jgi:mannitol-specific phosphotransferase system IIBC component
LKREDAVILLILGFKVIKSGIDDKIFIMSLNVLIAVLVVGSKFTVTSPKMKQLSEKIEVFFDNNFVEKGVFVPLLNKLLQQVL